MDKPKIKKDYSKKIQKLSNLNKYYYDLSKPLVDDKEYDKIKNDNDELNNICEDCKKENESVSQNLIMYGYKICESCRTHLQK